VLAQFQPLRGPYMPPAPVYTVPTVPINGEMGYRLQQNGMDIGEIHPLPEGVDRKFAGVYEFLRQA